MEDAEGGDAGLPRLGEAPLLEGGHEIGVGPGRAARPALSFAALPLLRRDRAPGAGSASPARVNSIAPA